MEKAGQRWWETTRWSKGGPLELQKRLLGSAHEDGAGFSLRGRGAEQRSVCWGWEVAAEAWAGPVDMATVTWAQRDTLCLPGGGPAEIVILDYPLTRFVSWALANIGGICVAQKYVGYLLRLKPDCELLFPLSGAAARADTLSARPHPLGLFFHSFCACGFPVLSLLGVRSRGFFWSSALRPAEPTFQFAGRVLWE